MRYSVLFACLIVVLSLRKVSGGVVQVTHLDKLAHFYMYGTWAIILSMELQKQYSDLSVRYRSIGVIFLAFLFGTVMELLQSIDWVGRSFEINDIIANITGAAAGVMIIALFSRK